MTTAYLNCASGIAGDMLMAAAVDAGIPPRSLEKELKRALKLRGWSLSFSEASEHGGGKRLIVKGGERRFRSPGDMRKILSSSAFSPAVKRKMLAVFDTITGAESEVHGIPVPRIHFHEMNALDTIVDIAGNCRAFEMLGVEKLLCSPVNIGRAAPAALAIIRRFGIPVWSDTPEKELATPTGIALAASLSDGFCDMPAMRITASGRGFGHQRVPGKTNALQLLISSSKGLKDGYGSDAVMLLETNIDDMDPRVYPYVSDRLFQAGALDVWLTQIMMKKGRPGTMISVLCPRGRERDAVDILFHETTTLGIRRTAVERWTLPRVSAGAEKKGMLPGGRVKTGKEYRVAEKKAVQTSKPLRSFLG